MVKLRPEKQKDAVLRLYRLYEDADIVVERARDKHGITVTPEQVMGYVRQEAKSRRQTDSAKPGFEYSCGWGDSGLPAHSLFRSKRSCRLPL